jgi:hypothetical protein
MTDAPPFRPPPEFGPPGYMPTLPFTNQPVADAWRVNVEMRKLLIEALGTEGVSP